MADEDWFTVRCVFRWTNWAGTPYEERITLWRAVSLDDAIARAEQEARGYADENGVEYVGLVQAYQLAAEQGLVSGAEVFSLVRDSELDPDGYVTAFFATGGEHQTDWSDHGDDRTPNGR
jgi:hypothetical protein